MCDTFTKQLSTADVAAALGVGESSVKRWIDAGSLAGEKTPGGHRRVALSDLYSFLRQTGRKLLAPEKLGLKVDAPGHQAKTPAEVCKTSLADGDAFALESALHALRMADMAPSAILDRILYPAFQDVRATCQHPSEECLVLHRAMSMTQLALRETMAPEGPRNEETRPRVVFADVGYEVDGLPAFFAEAAVWDKARCLQLGTSVPAKVIEGALDGFKPDVLWLSASGPARRGRFGAEWKSIEAKARRLSVKTIAFGDATPRTLGDATARVTSFGEFRGFVTALAD